MTKWTIEKPQTGRHIVQDDGLVCVYIDKRGDMTLSIAAHDSIGKPSYCHMLSDSNGNVGIMGATEKDFNTYSVGYKSVSSHGGQHNLRIACKAVTKKHALIPADGVLRYMAYIDDGVLIISKKQVPQKVK